MKGRFLINSLYNIIATMIPMFILQFIALPVVAKLTSVEYYGMVLTLISIANLIVQVSGTGINNTRIVMNSKYESHNLQENFNKIAKIIIVIIVPITLLLVLLVQKNTSILFLTLFIFYIILGFLNQYLSSEYNINVNYKMVMFSNIFQALGYILGIGIFIATNNWIYILLFGMLFTVCYELKTTFFWRKKNKESFCFKEACNKVIMISISSVMISLVTYADRLFLYPILGPTEVAIYYTSSLFGKLISMGLGPVSSVLLSVFSIKNEINRRQFWKLNLLNFSLCILFYLVTLVVSVPIINMLYPSLGIDISAYAWLANLAAILTASSGLVQPMILKFCPIKWQTIIQITHLLLYLFLSILFINFGGLLGFCVASVLISFIKLLLLCTIGHIYIKK